MLLFSNIPIAIVLSTSSTMQKFVLGNTTQENKHGIPSPLLCDIKSTQATVQVRNNLGSSKAALASCYLIDKMRPKKLKFTLPPY